MLAPGQLPKPLAGLPWRLIFLVGGIALFGCIALYSTAGGSLSPWAAKQFIIFLGFFGAAVVISYIREATIKALIFPAYIAIVVMLIGVEALGLVKKGAQRWLDLGFIRLQPSEFMKVAIVLVLARFYELLPAGEIRKWRALWPALLMLGVPAALVLLQPDLGTTLMIVFCGVSVLFLAGLPMWYFVGTALTCAAAMPILYSTLHEYQRKRVMTFMDPESDPLGAGYHISQSKIAIGSGGIFGKGYLNGSQSHLDYLPEGHTDFAFAAIIEEWGLLGGLALVVAWGLVIRWALRVASRAPSRFGKLTAGGLASTLFFYCSINLLMVMGMAPVVGVPLPLVSFGGSAVMTTMICIGLLMGIERQSRGARQSA